MPFSIYSHVDYVQYNWRLKDAISARMSNNIEEDTGTRFGWWEHIEPELASAFDQDLECIYISIPNALKAKGLVSNITSIFTFFWV